MLQARWSRESEEWVRKLPKFADLLFPHLAAAVNKTMRWGIREARPDVPVFEGDLQEDLQFVFGPRRMGNYKLRVLGIVGFTDATVQPEMESGKGPKPFAVARGKHEPGAAGEHGVFLYHPGSGSSTKGRAKLVRWMQENAGYPYTELPDSPDKEDVQKWQQDVENETGTKPRPFVVVDPSLSATDFLWQLIAQDGDPMVSVLVDNVYRAVGRIW